MSTVKPISKRVKKLDLVELKHGGHSPPENPDNGPPAMCFNEAIVWLVGEDWSDAPQCVSPVIRQFGMRLNDRLNDSDRQRLKPFVLPSIGTVDDGQDEARKLLCANWAYREALPKWLDACEENDWAKQLRELPEFTSLSEVDYGSPARQLMVKVRDAMWQRRNARYDRIRESVKAELEKRGLDKDAVAAAVAAAAADAVAAAAADAAAVAGDAPEYGTNAYWKWRSELYDAVKAKVQPIYEEKLGQTREEILRDGLELFGKVVNPADPVAA